MRLVPGAPPWAAGSGGPLPPAGVTRLPAPTPREPMHAPTDLTRRQCLAALSSLPLLGLAAGAAPAAPPRAVAVRFGRLVDGKGRTLTDAVVVVEDGRIASV